MIPQSPVSPRPRHLHLTGDHVPRKRPRRARPKRGRPPSHRVHLCVHLCPCRGHRADADHGNRRPHGPMPRPTRPRRHGHQPRNRIHRNPLLRRRLTRPGGHCRLLAVFTRARSAAGGLGRSPPRRRGPAPGGALRRALQSPGPPQRRRQSALPWLGRGVALGRRQKADVPVVTLHAARHGSVTYMIAAGVPLLVVSKWHGHDLPTMLRTYDHAPVAATVGDTLSALLTSEA